MINVRVRGRCQALLPGRGRHLGAAGLDSRRRAGGEKEEVTDPYNLNFLEEPMSKKSEPSVEPSTSLPSGIPPRADPQTAGVEDKKPPRQIMIALPGESADLLRRVA